MAPSNCSNGLNGVENGDGGVCCPEICDFCGGEGCGSIPGTKPEDCCAGNITDSGVYCTEGVEAPCILVNDTNTAAPTVTALPFSSPTPIDGGSNYLEDRGTLDILRLQCFYKFKPAMTNP